MLDARPSPIAGQWYESDPEMLARNVDEYLEEAQLPELDGEVIAVIAPHAGHAYSGAVAGYAFAALRGRSPDLVAVLSPVHPPKWLMPISYNDPILTSSHDAYATPLGNIFIDHAAVAELNTELNSELGFGLTPVSNDPEHSLEIELPFLQRALSSEWKLLPVMVHVREPRVSEGLGKALAKVLHDKNFALVASTDLSHFYNHKTALAYDRTMLRELESFNPEGAFDVEHAGKGFACGLGAFTAVMWASRELGADKVEVLRHATSGNVTGDYSSVVGYAAAVILKSTSTQS